MISIIVPAYNAARFLPATLDTVLEQTYPDWELLVINDGSTDDTEAVARQVAASDRWAGRMRVFTKENGGAGPARNYGFAQADPRSEFILFLDHDDFLEPIALETLLAAVNTAPDCVGAVGGVRENLVSDLRSDAEKIRTKIVEAQTPAKAQARSASDSSYSSDASDSAIKLLTFADMVTFCHIWTMGQVLIRRECLERVGPLDPACAPSEDWDLYLRLTLHGPLVSTATCIIHWTHHATNTSNDKQVMGQAEATVRAKLLASPDLSDAQRQMVISLSTRSRRNLAASQLQWAREALSHRQFSEAIRQTRRAAVNYLRSRFR